MHHVTQRGDRLAPVFLEDADYALYRDLLAERCCKASVACWAYCLMPNHMHLILVPSTADGLARAIASDNSRLPYLAFHLWNVALRRASVIE
jgi:putative transposase